jgi:hypothetical protein
MNNATRLKTRLAAVVKKQQAALAELGKLLANPASSSVSTIDETQATVARLNAQQQRIVQDLKLSDLERPERYGAYNARSGQRPIREVVLDILDELGVPSSPGTLSECAAVWSGMSIPAGRFASLRRDEHSAYRRDSLARPTWLVPALNANGFRAIPRLVVSSVWEPERRLIGPRTLRVNHLKTVLALQSRLTALNQTGASGSSDRLLELMHRYARSIPGAMQSASEIDADQVRHAAQSELDAIEPLDIKDRRTAVSEFFKIPAYAQLWGLPAVIEGGAGSLRKAAGR